jgi:hypothetical protein
MPRFPRPTRRELQLPLVQLAVQPAPRQQLVVVAHLADAPFLQCDDLVGVADRTQPMDLASPLRSRRPYTHSSPYRLSTAMPCSFQRAFAWGVWNA